DRRAAGRDTGDLHRVLDRLGARVHEQRLLLASAARRDLAEPPADLDVRLVHADHRALVEVAVDLLVHPLHYGPQRVPGVRAADAAGEGDVLGAVDVPDPRALGALDVDRRGREAADDVALPGGLDVLGGGALLQGQGTTVSRRFSTIQVTSASPGYDGRAPGALAEWLGSGLQSRLQRFESPM